MRYRSPRSIQAYQVVLADSHGIPRAPHYSGTNPEPRHRGTAYTTITHYGRPSQGVRLPRQHGTTPRQRGNRPAPQHPARNGRRLSHARGLAIIRFRSPLLTEYLFLRVLRCFTSPRSLQLPYTFRQRSPDTTPESRLPHSEIPGSQLVYQLPWAYRRLQRPSSALGAKASTDRTK